MDRFEQNSHSFIIRIWLEESVDETGQALWRGHITHVLNERRQYIQNLDEIIAFIKPYLKPMGDKTDNK
jgi:hypothetical protein